MRTIEFISHPDITRLVYDEMRSELIIFRLRHPPCRFENIRGAVVRRLVELPIKDLEAFMETLRLWGRGEGWPVKTRERTLYVPGGSWSWDTDKRYRSDCLG